MTDNPTEARAEDSRTCECPDVGRQHTLGTQDCMYPAPAVQSDPARCGRCGDVAQGLATIDGARYCHEGPDPTCYMLQSWADSGTDPLIASLLPAPAVPDEEALAERCDCANCRDHDPGFRWCCRECHRLGGPESHDVPEAALALRDEVGHPRSLHAMEVHWGAYAGEHFEFGSKAWLAIHSILTDANILLEAERAQVREREAAAWERAHAPHCATHRGQKCTTANPFRTGSATARCRCGLSLDPIPGARHIDGCDGVARSATEAES